ncbi:putative sulfite oxidase [Besnoitia besnoiti]|uniref:Putative sulfite oxidase n=1 Tax=Besnoitia besnoiti TaxID=94643 RepID=A0A2A9M7R2_BESBE|nr:putative sulfite oxidase [Besnoitia besnoiti]PFH31687.1 putative sulfite oxidase [Besnoitia besnoiti]
MSARTGTASVCPASSSFLARPLAKNRPEEDLLLQIRLSEVRGTGESGKRRKIFKELSPEEGFPLSFWPFSVAVLLLAAPAYASSRSPPSRSLSPHRASFRDHHAAKNGSYLPWLWRFRRLAVSRCKSLDLDSVTPPRVAVPSPSSAPSLFSSSSALSSPLSAASALSPSDSPTTGSSDASAAPSSSSLPASPSSAPSSVSSSSSSASPSVSSVPPLPASAPPPSSPAFPQAGSVREGLPFYKTSDLRQHGTEGAGHRLWVAYRHGVYDVTDFIEKHPGGRERLLLAVGRELDPFWLVYGQHNLAAVHELLESMRIGNYEKEGIELDRDSPIGDAYANEPSRHPALTVRSERPFNAETPLPLLTDDFYTPNDLFFVRNHLPVPKVEPESYEVEIEIEFPNGERKHLASLTLPELKTNFYPHYVPCAIQCAGNRRDDFNLKTPKQVKGLEWQGGAIGNALWTGCLLADVLRHCGIDEKKARKLGIRHVHFEGHDCDPLTGTRYAASIPVHRAILGRTLEGLSARDATAKEPFSSATSFGSRDVLLAYEMNGKDLPVDHGAPVRVIVPGAVGARSVKWLKKITLSPRESDSHWQQQDYKIMSPNDTPSSTEEWRSKPSILDLPIQSAICLPTPHSILPPGADEVDLKGYAWCGGGTRVVRVDVSLDGGKTWVTADLQLRPDEEEEEDSDDARKTETPARDEPEPDKAWSWVLWTATLPLPSSSVLAALAGSSSSACSQPNSRSTEERREKLKNGLIPLQLLCRAVDAKSNSQPETCGPLWNSRGCLNNSWHAVTVYVSPPGGIPAAKEEQKM